MKRRMTMTLPHSHMGKIIPRNPVTRMAIVGFRGRIFSSRSEETKTSTSPEISEPSRRNGTPSKRTLRKATAKSSNLKVNQGMKKVRGAFGGAAHRSP